MKRNRVPLFWWLAWVGVQVWIVHPGIHSQSHSMADETGAVCSHSGCSHSSHPEDSPDNSHSHGPCELCAANCEKEPLDLGAMLAGFIASDGPLESTTIEAAPSFVQPILQGSLTLRGPPSQA